MLFDKLRGLGRAALEFAPNPLSARGKGLFALGSRFPSSEAFPRICWSEKVANSWHRRGFGNARGSSALPGCLLEEDLPTRFPLAAGRSHHTSGTGHKIYATWCTTSLTLAPTWCLVNTNYTVTVQLRSWVSQAPWNTKKILAAKFASWWDAQRSTLMQNLRRQDVCSLSIRNTKCLSCWCSNKAHVNKNLLSSRTVPAHNCRNRENNKIWYIGCLPTAKC